VMEAGAVEPIVQRPCHPYTKLLIASIPRVSVERTWMTDTSPVGAGVAASGGCSFADRCPVVMARCSEAVPLLYRTEDDRAVACYRHQTSPELPGEDLSDVLAACHVSPAQV
jgi:oligopeptide/dipeptide ABC transporter ATP-binding protein